MTHSCPSPTACRCSRKKNHCLSFIAGIAIGSSVAMFFVQDNGETLRKKMKRSKTPIRDFCIAHIEMKMSAFMYFHEKIKKMLEK